jgi:hypothetical protein
MRFRSPWRASVSVGAGAFFALLMLGFASDASALSTGTLAGTVTDAGGPVAGARVLLVGANNNITATTTDGAGSFSLEAWPDTYRVGAFPPSGSSDEFSSVSGLVVAEGVGSTADIALAPTGPTHVSGSVSYPGHPPDAGVEVFLAQERFQAGTETGYRELTDEAGTWDAGNLPAGFYRVSYSAPRAGTDLQQEPESLGSDLVAIEGPRTALTKEVSGALPAATMEVSVTAAEGWPSPQGSVTIALVGGGVSGTVDFVKGHATVAGLPTGTFLLTAEDSEEDDRPGTATISVSEGKLSLTAIQLPPKPGLAGIAPSNEQTDLGWLNEQRTEWGLPAGVGSVPLWSQACASHDAYEAQNQKLEHGENAGLSGHSEGGQWGGEHGLIASNGTWSRTQNPWMDAPYHLEQLFAPRLIDVGLDGTANYQCEASVWGIRRPSAPAGVVYTFPGNGTTGVPPSEYAIEFTGTPNEVVGLPNLTGRQLIVWQESGGEEQPHGIDIESASLSSANGPVEIKTLRGNIGAFIIPVKALDPFTQYTATVELGPSENSEGRAVGGSETHSWSFTTGKPNPRGNWDEYPEEPVTRSRSVRITYGKGHVIVKGSGFEAGAILVRKKGSSKSPKKEKKASLGKVLARAQSGQPGTFVARFRWPKSRRIGFRVYQGDTWLNATYVPKHKKKHHKRHRHQKHHHGAKATRHAK